MADEVDDEMVNVAPDAWFLVALYCSMHTLSALIGVSRSARDGVVRRMARATSFAGDEATLNAEQVQARISVVLLQLSTFLTGGGGVGKTFISTAMLRDLSTYFESPHERIEYARAVAAHTVAMQRYCRLLDAYRAHHSHGQLPPQPPQPPTPPRKLQVLVTASTGAAAQLNGGRTVHSAFNVRNQKKRADNERIVSDEERNGNELDYDATEFLADAHDHDDNAFEAGGWSTDTWMVIVQDGRLRTQLKNVNVLVVDEVSMVDGDLLNLIDRAFKTAREDSRPFGGVTVLFVGDFCQLAPVITESEKNNGGNHGFAFHSQSWLALRPRVVDLVVAVRQSEGSFFFDMLKRWRKGNATRGDINWLKDNGHQLPAPTPDAHTELGLMLTARCRLRDERNKIMLERVDEDMLSRDAAGNPRLCDSYLVRVGGIDPSTREEYPFHHKDAWHKLPERPTVPGPPIRHHKKAADTFEFKPKARVRCTKNITERDTRRLLVANGSVGTVTDYENVRGTDVVKSVTVLWDKTSRDGDDFEHTIEPAYFDRTHGRLYMYPRKNELLPVKAVRYQLPLEVCYAKTVHSAQGSSIFAPADLRIDSNQVPSGRFWSKDKPIFVPQHGQIYTAVSRFAHEGLIRNLPERGVHMCKPEDVYCDPAVIAFYNNNVVAVPAWLRAAMA